MKTALGALVAVLLSGCAASSSPVPVSVAVPTECRVSAPARPVMPTESLSLGVGLDSFVKAAQAEIEIREGYEGQLRAALTACTSR